MSTINKSSTISTVLISLFYFSVGLTIKIVTKAFILTAQRNITVKISLEISRVLIYPQKSLRSPLPEMYPYMAFYYKDLFIELFIYLSIY